MAAQSTMPSLRLRPQPIHVLLAALTAMLSSRGLSAVMFGKIVVSVSAWAPTITARCSSNLRHRRSFLGWAQPEQQPQRFPFLNFRGGTSSSPNSLVHTLGTNAESKLHASTAEDPSTKDTDEAFSGSYEQALKLDLPVLEFGGLSYWKTIDDATQQPTKFRVLFILGGPGAGKGTQSALMAENYPVVHLSVGQLLRQEQTKADSPHRALIEKALVAGSIVPVEISLALVQKAMEEASAEAGSNILFLVDGFPRNEDNLSGWCRYMGEYASIWSVLFYHCPLDVLEARILERAKNSGRSDDNIESIHKRFATFERETLPIIRKLGVAAGNDVWSVTEIAGNQTMDEVWLATQQSLNQLIRHDVLTANAQLLRAVETGDVDAYQGRCDPLWFQGEDTDAAAVMAKQEGKPMPLENVCDAELEFVSGKHVAVSYTRTMEGEEVREKRVWVYQGHAGWRLVHFARTPAL